MNAITHTDAQASAGSPPRRLNRLDYAKARPGFWYLATPYTRHPEGFDAAYEAACRAAAYLNGHGLPTFSPIAHGHGLAKHGGLSFTDPKLWQEIDAPFVGAAAGIIVCKMPTWETSSGVTHEINEFRRARKPVLELAWPILEPDAAPFLPHLGE